MRKPVVRCLLILWLVAFGGTAAFAGAWEDILRAAEANDTETVTSLMARGMDVNTSDRTGTTLLMIAARNGNEALLEVLLINRANTLKRNKYGDSSVSLAAMAGHLAVLKRLVEYGVPLSGDGWSPLQYGAFAGRTEVVGYLLSKGAPINAKAPNGQTPLMLAVGEGQIATVALLIESGADLAATDPQGRTALEIAEGSGKTEIAELLRKRGSR